MYVNILIQFFLGAETQSSLWKAVAFFLESIALHDITAAEKCFGAGAAGDRPSPQEAERYNYSKCTVVVRVLEFSTTLLGTSPDSWKVGPPAALIKEPVLGYPLVVLAFLELSLAIGVVSS